MTVYSPKQIYEAMMRHGAASIDPNKRVIWVAIALAESSGNDQAVGPVGERGVWQIYLKAHPDVTAAQAIDIETGTEAARKISNNWTNFQPWSTYNHGTYKKFLTPAVLGAQQADPKFFTVGPSPAGQVGAAAGAVGGAIGNVATDAVNATGIPTALSDVGGFLREITNPQLWKRLGIGALGIGLLIVAVFLLTDLDVGDLAKGAAGA